MMTLPTPAEIRQHQENAAKELAESRENESREQEKNEQKKQKKQMNKKIEMQKVVSDILEKARGYIELAAKQKISDPYDAVVIGAYARDRSGAVDLAISERHNVYEEVKRQIKGLFPQYDVVCHTDNGFHLPNNTWEIKLNGRLLTVFDPHGVPATQAAQTAARDPIIVVLPLPSTKSESPILQSPMGQ